MNNNNVRIAEVDYDPTANHNMGHVPGAVLFDSKKGHKRSCNSEYLQQANLRGFAAKILS